MTVILRDIQLSVLLVAQRVQTFLSKHSKENQQDESLSLLYLPVILTALRQITILKPGKKKKFCLMRPHFMPVICTYAIRNAAPSLSI